MARIILLRTAGTAVMLVVISVLIFLLTYLSPGNLITNLTGLHPPTPAVAAALRREYGLNQPLVIQYLHWLNRFVHGNLGTLHPRPDLGLAAVRRPCRGDARPRRAGLCHGGARGCASGRHRSPARRRPSRQGNLSRLRGRPVGPGLRHRPAAAVRVRLPGLGLPPAGAGQGLFDDLDHLALPATTLAIGVGAYIVRLTRTAMRRELDSDYVVFARARG